MRIRVTFELERTIGIPIDHQYALMSAIYGFIERSDRDFAAFLHDRGYGEESRRFKAFCFGGLRSRRRRVDGDTLHLGPGSVEWKVTSPIEEFLRNFCSSLLREGRLEIAGRFFPIATAESEPDPVFENRAAFTCLSPITVSTHENPTGSRHAHYMRPEEGIGDAVAANLARKYEALHGRPPADARLKWTWDADYLKRKEGRITKLVTIKRETPEETRIVGMMAPFTVEGSPELIALGYAIGFGEKNSAGFGMVEVKSNSSLDKQRAGSP